MIKIPKTMLKGFSARLTPTWLTNGHWAIKRELLDATQRCWEWEAWAAWCGSDVTPTDDTIMDQVERQSQRAWTCTYTIKLETIGRGKGTTRRFKEGVVFRDASLGTGEETAIDRDYWEMLGQPDCLYGETKDGALALPGRDAVVMPMPLPSWEANERRSA